MGKTEILDTTLRDGEQGCGVSFSPESAVKVVRLLDGIVDIIEAGYAGANAAMDRRFELLRELQEEGKLKSRIAAFGMTRSPNSDVSDHEANPYIGKLYSASTPVVVVVGKAWDHHVKRALRTELPENLRMIADTISYFYKMGKEVIFDAEMFTSAIYGGIKAKPNQAYSIDCLEAAFDAGASRIVLCDTVGMLKPDQVDELVSIVEKKFGIERIGFHGHNDFGFVGANTYLMWKRGITHLHATVNGFGERTGNARLAETLFFTGHDTSKQYNLSRDIALLATGHKQDRKLTFVGDDANTDKAGIHASATRSDQFAYRAIDLETTFGTPQRVVVSDVGGRSNIAMKLGANPRDPYVAKVYDVVQHLTGLGYDFTTADASFFVQAYRLKLDYSPPFTVWRSYVEKNVATIMTDGTTAFKETDGCFRAHGEGPVNAFYNAYLMAFQEVYPGINAIKFREFSAMSTSSELDTSQLVRVTMTFNVNGELYTVMGVSKDIERASEIAIFDGIEYGMIRLKELEAHKPQG